MRIGIDITSLAGGRVVLRALFKRIPECLFGSGNIFELAQKMGCILSNRNQAGKLAEIIRTQSEVTLNKEARIEEMLQLYRYALDSKHQTDM